MPQPLGGPVNAAVAHRQRALPDVVNGLDAAAILSNPLFAAAVENARHELPVYAARPRSKAPLWRGWQRAATTKVQHLADIWERHPRANVGIACRGLVVLDADSQRAAMEVEELELPPTTTVRTARGAHWYFLGGLAGAMKTTIAGVELRGRGQGVLGAGSVHPSGRLYEWIVPPWEAQPVPLPDEVRRLVLQPRSEAALPGEAMRVFPGGRSVHLLRVGAGLRARYGIVDVAPVLEAFNEAQCCPPLPAEKVARLAREAEKLAFAPWADPVRYASAATGVSQIGRHILALLARHADHKGECFPGVRRLSELASTNQRRVVAAIRELESAGWVSVERSRRGNRYRLAAAVSPPAP
jgi:bifunctional DNA primase/polymerase-like protein/helix-turn-helix protein